MEREERVSLYRRMALIRRFEEAAAEQYGRGRIGGFLHLYIGEEACAVGAIHALQSDDYLVTHYRDHGHALAKGSAPRAVMAELFGRTTGVSRGMGGSMHLFDVPHRMMGGYAIVGGGIPIGMGIALGVQYRGEPLVCLDVFGDGSVNEGAFHESLNMASLWKLPVVFFCENNLYAMGTALARSSAVPEIYKRAEVYAMPSSQVDGMDVEAVYRVTAEAVERARDGGGPTLIEAVTYRFRGHSMADAVLYRTREEESRWKPLDPIVRYREVLTKDGAATVDELNALDRAVVEEVDDAVRFAEESPNPTVEQMCQFVYAGEEKFRCPW